MISFIRFELKMHRCCVNINDKYRNIYRNDIMRDYLRSGVNLSFTCDTG